ncbi:MAG: TauD/TfdA family dioxygenase, partial [Rhodospirillaceae bacterium]
MEVTPLGEALGAEVRGVDVRAINSAELIQLKKTFLKFHVVVFRDQNLTPTDQIEFSRNFGSLEIHISTKYLLKDRPEVLVLSNRKENGEYIGVENAGDYWHSDLSYMGKPSLGSL